ncbi:MAG: hypothetical protein M3R61_00005, partial [Chloroflexota bacterium]|nr:hypothetical protein [Chloroflexota bacterium]
MTTNTFSADQALTTLGAAAERDLGWRATCGQCRQQFISDVPVADGANCPSCACPAAEVLPG